jgi:hypothetical protein
MAISLPSSQQHLVLVAALLLLPGCDSSSPTAPETGARPLPGTFRLIGSADSVEPDGTTVSCLLDLHFELTETPRVTPEGLEYEGIHGGEIRRTVLDARGDGISLWPDVHGPAVAFFNDSATTEIYTPAKYTAQGSWTLVPMP